MSLGQVAELHSHAKQALVWNMTGGGEKQENLQQAKESDLFEKISEMMEEEKKNKRKILNRLDVLNEMFSEKLDIEKLQR
jgi:hypothetical protein